MAYLEQVGDLTSQLLRMTYQRVRFEFMPESFYVDMKMPNPSYDDYPLRPEFVESTYFLHKATGHPFYVKVGERVVANLQKYARVPCGFTSVGVRDLRKDDRMDSYFLSETLKYLYLLFSDTHWVSPDDQMFTTEAHLLPFSAPITDLILDEDSESNELPEKVPFEEEKLDIYLEYHFSEVDEVQDPEPASDDILTEQRSDVCKRPKCDPESY